MEIFKKKNFYVVDAQGFHINKKFHARELYFTNAYQSFGLELDLDMSYRDVMRLSDEDYKTTSHQTKHIHGLPLYSRRHSLNKAMIDSGMLPFVLTKIYELLSLLAEEPVVFAVKNHHLLRILRNLPSIKHVINLDAKQYEIP